MAKLTPKEAQEKHNRRLKAALPDMERGILNVKVAPGKAAAEKADKMKQNLNKALDEGKWQRRVAAVPLEDWQNKMVKKGLPRVSGGIDAAADKVVDFFEQFLPHMDKVQAKVKAMPDLTLEDSAARMVANMKGAADFKRK